MQSDFVLLSQLLQQDDPTVRYKQGRDSGGLLRLYAAAHTPDRWDEDTLYLLPCSRLPEVCPAKNALHLLCVQDAPPPPWLFQRENVSVITTQRPYDEETAEVYLRRMQTLGRNASAALAEITDALYYGKGLQAIVDMGAKLIGNPIFILDTGFKALAISRSVPVKNPAIRRDAARGYLDENAVRFMRERSWFDSLRREGNILFFPSSAYQEYVGESSVHEWCYCYIKINGIVAAYLNVFGENTPLFDYHKAWIMKLAQLAAIEMQKDSRFANNRGAMYEALLTDLLSGRITDQMAVLRRLKLLDRKLKKYLRVVTVRKADGHARDFTPIEQERIRDFFPGSSSVAYGEDIVLLTSSDDDSLRTKEGERLTGETFTLNGLVAGVSNTFENVTEMRRYYLQSLKALAFGTHIFSKGKLFYYADYTVFHALDVCTERMELRDLCHPGVLKLRESSNAGDHELYQTLYLYLLYMKDVNRVAADMHVHKGTLYYRLKKLQTELGVNLDNGNDVFQLMFSYKLEEYMDIFEPGGSPLPCRPATPEELLPYSAKE